MPAPTTVAELIELIRKSGVIDGPRLTAYLQQLQDRRALPTEPVKLADQLVRDAVLTYFQRDQFLLGKWRGFTIDKYRILEKLGSGGMGQVYLAEHRLMRRKVAIKVLPSAKARDPSSLQRFHREGRAVAALDHPNLVRAFDIGEDEADPGRAIHYLVMEYVDGASLHEIVKKVGPLDPGRAASYVQRAAEGLQYAYEVAGLIHRDIKPANIMVDRQGAVKILDMGLARFFNDEDDMLTRKYDENVLGTADYLSPEQATDSHTVDIRADIYSLGATFYFMLAGHPPFPDGTVAQKLIRHQTQQPKPVRLLRPGVPEGLAAVLERMMMKDPAARYQTPAELAGAVAPFVPDSVPPPADEELPRLSPAAAGAGSDAIRVPAGSGPASAAQAERWSPPPVPARSAAAAPGRAATAVEPPQRTAASKHRGGKTPPPEPPSRPGSNPFTSLLGSGERPAANVYATAAERATGAAIPPPLPRRRRGQRGWLVAIALGVVLAGGAFAVWRLSSRPDTPTNTPPTPQRLTVARDSGQGQFRTIAAAVAHARPGDEVVLLDPVHEEPTPVTLDPRHGPGVTIAGGLPDGRPVTWRLPPGKAAGWLVKVNGCDGPRLSRLVLDGLGLIDTPLRLIGRCPGATIDDVLLQRFKLAAVKIANCSGDPGRPVVIRRVRATADVGEVDSGIVLSASPAVSFPRANENVIIRDCRLEGPFKVAIEVDGPAQDVSVEHSRVWNATEGVRCREIPPDGSLRLTLNGNTFADMGVAVATANAPDDRRSRLDLRQNLFATCRTILQVDTGAASPFVVAELNGRDKDSKDGQLPSPAQEFSVEFVSSNPARVGFLSYPKDSPIARAGANGSPIGVPAD
jgi:serine/threonine protein kinase